MVTCISCDKKFEEDNCIYDSHEAEYYCQKCFNDGDLKKCPDCERVVDHLEKDGLCESCSPDDYWKKEDPDFMDSYDPDID
ncbi:hypothetical protein ACQCN2_13340 [Brevibacillus ginsengisoli]|uniref:hypothetical protein n=1 Tax=Brevibacillus ginsengisoli TaxID=363854 RepID=UPI003CF58260